MSASKTAVPENEYKVLDALFKRGEPLLLRDLAAEIGVDQSQVSAICLARAEIDHISIDERSQLELRLGAKGRELADAPFPERAIIGALYKLGGSGEIPELADPSGLDKKAVGQSLRWLKQKGWAEQKGRTITLTAAGRAAMNAKLADEKLVAALASVESKSEAELVAEGHDVAAARALLAGRSGVLDERERKSRLVALTDAGRALVKGGLTARKQITQLTDELLRSGEWRDADIRPYDVTLAAEPIYAGKSHPMVSIIEQTRRVFLEMGFDEIQSPYVESSFWDFDALFQPQDHPARDMQDTFYVARPAQAQLPDEATVQSVKATHEDGGSTESLGWRYDWDVELSRRPVLRTHATAATIRALAKKPKGPRKVFCVGPVFRRETVDYKHLPVFHQVDGVVIDAKASFANLLGTLATFYRKMGFSRFDFRPAFFPYTEPSVEVFVWLEKKGDWVEMGGAGMFRPEVTQPLGCDEPVLAWGLGLERLAMFRYELSNISELYRARLSWLKETPLCR
ncbi:MAG: phenylalanine--tRNA ligase subunit alpha [Myxococcales bacterium]|nr:phenylalanine--tRNA ligase subunit alpha [Myxococcales bacterium]